MDFSSLFAQCRAYGAQQSSIELAPAQPAVYAFYDLFRFGHDSLPDDVDTFLTKHGKVKELDESELPVRLRIKLKGSGTRFKGEARRLWSALDPNQRPDICHALAFLSFLNEPHYIGKTDNLRTRFRQHHDSGFLYKRKLDTPPRSPSEFLLVAYLCSTEDEARLLESILIQLINPFYCTQKS